MMLAIINAGRKGCININANILAENTAVSCKHKEWLDNKTHWVWNTASKMIERYGT